MSMDGQQYNQNQGELQSQALSADRGWVCVHACSLCACIQHSACQLSIELGARAGALPAPGCLGYLQESPQLIMLVFHAGQSFQNSFLS